MKKYLSLFALSMISVMGANAACEGNSFDSDQLTRRACCKNRCEQYKDGKNALGNQRYSRVVVLSQDNVYAGPANPLDPNHSQALAFRNYKNEPLYTPEQLFEMELAGFTDFYNKFGINLLGVTPQANGTRIIPGLVTYIPSIIGANKKFFLVEDTSNPERGLSDRWYDLEVGGLILVSSVANWIVPPGHLYAGARLVPSSIFSFGEINLLKNNSPEREIIRFTTDWLALLKIDQWNNPSYTIALTIFDQCNRKGTYLGATVVLREPDSSVQGFTNFLQERPVLTWDCPL